MQHFGALALAALLRWRRWLRDVLSQLYKRLSHQDAEVTAEEWNRFELEEMRRSAEVMLLAWVLVSVVHLFAMLFSFGLGLSKARTASLMGCVALGMLVTLTALLLRKRANQCKDNVMMERRMLVIHQCVLISCSCLAALSCIYNDDELTAHRGFIMKFSTPIKHLPVSSSCAISSLTST